MLGELLLAASAIAGAPAEQGVTSYPPAFFAAARPATALDLVQRLPGFSLDVGSGVRGYEGAAGNVLIDGRRPATKTDTLDSLLLRIPADRVARIDVIRGGAPGIDMQGKTVLANVILKADGGAHGLFAVAERLVDDGRSLPAVRLEGSGRLGTRSWEAGLFVGRFADTNGGDGARTRVDAAQRPLLAGSIHLQGAGIQTILTGAAETPLWGGDVRATGRINVTPFNENEVDTFSGPGAHLEHEHDDDNVSQTEFGLRFNRRFGARLGLEAVALRQDRRELAAAAFEAPGDAEDFRLDNRTSETIARAVLKFQQTAALSWEAGGEGAYNTLRSQTTFVRNGAAVALPAANVTVTETRGEAFGKAVWRASPKLTLEAGLREEGSRIAASGDVSLRKSLYFTKPRLALTWSPSDDSQVRLRVEREVGQLDFGAFVASQSLSAGVLTAGNPNLEPEKDWVSEAAFERRFAGQGAIVLTLRHAKIDDAIDRAPFGAFDAPANIGSGTRDEAILNLTLPLDRLGLAGAQLRGQSAWRRSEVTDPTTGQRRPITALHPNDWDAHFVQDLPSWKAKWGVDATGAWRETYFRFNEVELRKLETSVTVYAQWTPRADLNFRAEIDNVTGAGFKRTLDHFAGARGTAPLAFVEDRDPHFGRMFYVHMRKSLGNP